MQVKLQDKKGTVLNYHKNLVNDAKMFSKTLMKVNLPKIDPVDVFVVRSQDSSLINNNRPYLLDDEGYDFEEVGEGLGKYWKDDQALT
jgi:hypothetical protein